MTHTLNFHLGRFTRHILLCACLLSTASGLMAQDADSSEIPNEDQPFDPVEVVDAPAPAKPLEVTEPVGFGNIVGTVFDPDKSKELRGVDVVLEWPGAEADDLADNYPRQEKTVSNKAGEFRFTQVPAGFFTVRFYKEGYETGEMRNFEVLANTGNKLNFPLRMESAGQKEGQMFVLDEFAAGGEVVDDSRVLLDDLARDSAGSINFLSSEDFSKYAATDLADVVARLPGVNVVEGKFAVVRGLGDRYNSTLVNGLPVPSPDPLRQGLQLDLFPTSIIENVVTNKQFLPYMPSNSSGAAFELNTKAYPDEFTTWFGVGARFNSNAEDSFFRDPNGTSMDLLGYGKSSRPPSIGSDSTPRAILDTLRPTFSGKDTGPPVGTKLSVGFGDTLKIFDRNIGVIASGSYDSSYKTFIGTQQNQYGTSSVNLPPGFGVNLPPGFFAPGSLFLGELWGSDAKYDVTSSIGTVQIGGLAGFSVDLDKEGTNMVSFNTLYSHNAQDFVQRRSNGYLPPGYSNGSRKNDAGTTTIITDFAPGDPGGYFLVGRGNGDNQLLFRDTISYEERDLRAFQLNGEHLIDELDNLLVTWGASYATTASDLPGQSVFNYSYQTNTADGRTPGYWIPEQQDFGQSGLSQLWRNIDEDVRSARADLDYDWTFLNGLEGNARAGFYYEGAERHTDQVSVSYNISTGSFGAGDPTFATPNALQNAIYYQSVSSITPNGILPSSPQPSFADNTRNIRAVYGQVTLPISEKIKVTGGARFEDLTMTADGNAVLGILTLQDVLNNQLPGGSITNGDILGWTNANDPGLIESKAALPSVTFTYDILDDLTLRGGFGRTLARPSFREMAPYFSLDLESGDLILGNPQLQLSPVDSWDLRLEYRFGDGDMVAASVFYKDVYNPIERVLLRAPGGQTFLSFINNPDRAVVKGFELEARTSLRHWAEELKYFSIGANWTMINATVAYPADIYQSYFRYAGQFPFGPFVGTDGPPNGNATVPQERRLFDQPEWIVNADLTFDHPDLGTTVTLSVFSQSDVLSSVGSGIDFSVDQFTGSFYQLDLTMQQAITENLKLKFAISNITDTSRTVFYSTAFVNSTVERISYKVGRNYRFALEYSF